MDIQLLIISPISGAIIGYFTNWLAIKMLFRPHYEKKIWGIKLPFTPGLIPKERYKLSKKVGEAIGTYLLTTETLTNKISSPEVSNKISSLLDEFINNLQKDNRNINQVFTDAFGESAPSLLLKSELYFVDTIKSIVVAPEFKENLASLVMEKVIEIIKSFDSVAVFQQTACVVKPLLRKKYLESISFANEKTLREFIPAKAVISIKELIRAKVPEFSILLQELLTENKDLNEKLKILTSNIIEENMGKFIGIFINKDKVYDNIKEAVFQYLGEAENEANIILKVWDFLDTMLDTNFGDLQSKIPERYREDIILKLDDMLKLSSEDNFYDKIWDSIELAVGNNKEFDLYKFILDMEPDFNHKLMLFIRNKIDVLINEELDALLHKVFNISKNKIMGVQVSSAIRKLPIPTLKVKLMEFIGFIIRKGAVYLAEGMDIGKLAENQINELDIAKGEEIILSVAKRELNAITIVGGVLGFVIGFVPVILSLFK